MVRLIKRNNEAKKTVQTDFILAHNLYARAEIPPANKVNSWNKYILVDFLVLKNKCIHKKVGLWLGANVMLEYTLEEAEDLLSKNLEQANLSMESTDQDLDFLK